MKKSILSSLFIAVSFYASGQVGIGTITPKAGLHVADSSVLFSAPGDVSLSPSGIPATGEGRRMMWYADRAAFRAGYVGGGASTNWNDNNIGNYSFAVGFNTGASGESSFAVGQSSIASGNYSVALGAGSNAVGERSMAVNGTASGIGAMALGYFAEAANNDALALGSLSVATGMGSIAIGPSIARGSYSVAIGLVNSASGDFSTALGKNARTRHRGSFVISDASASFSSDSAYSTTINQLTMRFSGGMRLFTDQQMTSGVTLAAGGGSWNVVSDKRKKENFNTFDAETILQKVAKMPVTTWNYKSQPTTTRHIGPMAQDFYAAFGLNGIGSDTTINSSDIDGVNMAAIQALEKRTKALLEENQQLKARLEALDGKMAALENRMSDARQKEEVVTSR
ncbi:tail fiber domain-containing protein [Dyadobacter crusticola]|uniref:tail fiber domain-containing protein n=1 Tax=Dyadobacter crusticola TaxID=292407 RepID=UPI00068D19B1|nr:tail fiber domain-containing protein [Dyadobacter crusticola]